MPAPLVPIAAAAVARLIAKHGAKQVERALKAANKGKSVSNVKRLNPSKKTFGQINKEVFSKKAASKSVEKKALKAANKPAKGAKPAAARKRGAQYQANRDKYTDPAATRLREGIKKARGKGK